MRPETRDEAIKAIPRNAERLERLTSDILDVTRIEGQRLNLNKEKFDVSEVITSCIEGIERRLDDSSIKFQYHPKQIVVEADRIRIAQAVSNLLNNAVKFTQQGTVYLSAENKDSYAEISIKDTRCGIDLEIIQGFSQNSPVDLRGAPALDYSSQ